MATTTNPNTLIVSIILLVALALGIAWYVNTHPQSTPIDTGSNMAASSTSSGTLRGIVQ